MRAILEPAQYDVLAGAGVHPDHAAVTDIVVDGVFYARLPKWDEIVGGDVLAGTEPHEIERLFFAHFEWNRRGPALTSPST